MKKNLLVVVSVLLVAAFALTACATTATATPTETVAAATTEAATAAATTAAATTAAPTASGKIAILLPETKTARYEASDLPDFKAKLSDLGFDVANNLIYSNANQDASTQQSQAEAAITNGATVLVLDPVDSDAAAAIADLAKSKNIPVISYDRLIKGSDGVTY